MTPLPRWVLLALLLVVVDAHPRKDACVCFCRARNGSSEIAEFCDQRLYQVSGNHGGAYLLTRLLNHCFISSGEPGSPSRPRFVDAEICRYIKDTVIRLYNCSCDTLNNGKSTEPEEEKQRCKNNEQFALKQLKMVKTREDVPAVPADAANQQGWRSTDLSEEELKIPVTDNRLNAMDADTTNAPEDETDSRENSIDWDLWCRAQCDNGQGGSACHCDIIP